MDWILGALLVQYALFEWNMSVYKPFRDAKLARWPRASILVPCRNEAPRIEKNVRTMLAQDYPDYEVLVFDDDSDDGSREILQRLAAENPRLRLLLGGELKSGWTGKNYGCHRLAEAATGEWLLFVDADTSHEPPMLRRAIGTAIEEKASFLSTFPRQIFRAGDELVVPLMFFILLTFLPMFFVARRTWRWAGDFAAVYVRFLLIEKDE